MYKHNKGAQKTVPFQSRQIIVAMLEEEGHAGSSTFVVVGPAVNENMAADRICNIVGSGRGRGTEMVNCLLWRWLTRTGGV